MIDFQDVDINLSSLLLFKLHGWITLGLNFVFGMYSTIYIQSKVNLGHQFSIWSAKVNNVYNVNTKQLQSTTFRDT